MAVSNQRFDAFISNVINLLREEAEQHKLAILNGEVENIERYRFLVGSLGGLQFAELQLIEQAKLALGIDYGEKAR